MQLDLVIIEDNINTPVLTQPASPVEFPLSIEDKAFIIAFKEKAIALGGVGLAAPQVGVRKQIIAFAISEEAKSLRKNANEVVPLTILFNPHYQPTENSTRSADWEGCFSVRDTYGKVPRYDQIYYTAQTESGEKISGFAEGFTARVLQHEIDHIQGILILKRLTPECIFGHPNEMRAHRINEFTPAQKEIFEKLVKQEEEPSSKK